VSRQAVLWCVQTPVDEFVDGTAGNVATGVRTAVVDQNGAVGKFDPAVAEGDIGNIAESFKFEGREEVTAGAGNDL